MKTITLISALIVALTSSVQARDIIVDIDGIRHSCSPTDSQTPGTGNPIACVEAAYRGPFSREESMRLCEGARTVAPAECALRAYRGPYSKEESLQLCQSAMSEGPVECADLAYTGPFSRSETLLLCSHPRASRANAQCALEAYRGPYSKEESIKLCRVQSGRLLKKAGLMNINKDDQEALVKEANVKALSLGEYK